VPDQEFAEPVALSSTQPTDVPLPRTAARLGLDLLALRARRKQHPTRSGLPLQGRQEGNLPQFASLFAAAGRTSAPGGTLAPPGP